MFQFSICFNLKFSPSLLYELSNTILIVYHKRKVLKLNRNCSQQDWNFLQQSHNRILKTRQTAPDRMRNFRISSLQVFGRNSSSTFYGKIFRICDFRVFKVEKFKRLNWYKDFGFENFQKLQITVTFEIQLLQDSTLLKIVCS